MFENNLGIYDRVFVFKLFGMIFAKNKGIFLNNLLFEK